MSGYNIKTSAFRVVGIDQNVYLSDIPDTNRNTGSIFFFTLPSVGSQSPTIVRRNVGIIDYVNGTYHSKPSQRFGGKSKDNQPIIEIEVTPTSK